MARTKTGRGRTRRSVKGVRKKDRLSVCLAIRGWPPVQWVHFTLVELRNRTMGLHRDCVSHGVIIISTSDSCIRHAITFNFWQVSRNGTRSVLERRCMQTHFCCANDDDELRKHGKKVDKASSFWRDRIWYDTIWN